MRDELFEIKQADGRRVRYYGPKDVGMWRCGGCGKWVLKTKFVRVAWWNSSLFRCETCAWGLREAKELGP